MRGAAALVVEHPTRGLDVGAVEAVWGELLRARQEGKAILLISAELEELLNLADRIAVMFEGRIMGMVDAAGASVEEIGLMMAGIHAGRGIAGGTRSRARRRAWRSSLSAASLPPIRPLAIFATTAGAFLAAMFVTAFLFRLLRRESVPGLFRAFSRAVRNAARIRLCAGASVALGSDRAGHDCELALRVSLPRI